MTHWRKKIDTTPDVRSFRALWVGVSGALFGAATWLSWWGMK